MAMGLDEKKRQAYSMHVRGHSVEEIASIMKRTPITIRNWLKDCSGEVHERLRTINDEDYVGILLSRFEALREEAWANYRSSTKKTDRGRFLKILMDLEAKELVALTKLGYISSEVEEGGLEEKALEKTAFMRDQYKLAQLDTFALEMVAKRMGTDKDQLFNMVPSITEKNFHALPEPYELSNSRKVEEDIAFEEPPPQPVTEDILPQASFMSEEDGDSE